jgi:hypothetical protein
MMKRTILKVIAALAFVCLVLGFAPGLLDNTNMAWIKLDSLSMRHNFYFGKRQWLADARTIVAAIRFLYQARSARPTSSINVVSNTPLALIQPEISNNLVLIDGTQSTILFQERRLSRAESLIVRKRLLSYCSALTSDWEIKDHVVTLRLRSLRSGILPTNAAESGLRNLPGDGRVTRMQGA